MNLYQVLALSGALAVGLGAFGAHALKGSLDAGALSVYQTAVFYHLTHTLAAFAALVLAHILNRPRLRLVAVLFIAGIVLFSGSLYLLAVTGIKWLGVITPIGGVSFLLAWLTLVFNVTEQHSGH